MKHLVICTAGRSGSTLLQGILNSQAGFFITGENSNLVLGIYRAYFSAIESRHQAPAQTVPANPWFGCEKLDLERFVADAQLLVTHQLWPDVGLDIRCLGFKEIRWLDSDLSNVNLWSYLTFLERLFPSCHFILLTRRIENLLQSGWWGRHDPLDIQHRIESFYVLMRNAPVRRLFEIDYEALSDPIKIRELLVFLGEPLAESAYANVVRQRHSYETSPQDRAHFDNIAQKAIIEQQATQIELLRHAAEQSRPTNRWMTRFQQLLRQHLKK